MKIVLLGGAGLVGQNVVHLIDAKHDTEIVVVDKKATNLRILENIRPEVVAIHEDICDPGRWEHHVKTADVVVMLQAQIGGLDLTEFRRNNVLSTERVLQVIGTTKQIRLIHVSSSVVNSRIHDFYSSTKKEQEELVRESRLDWVILRPTLMFGWFDRKHLGWLSRFMRRIPLFPVPGDGQFLRQPLYVRDFAAVVHRCIFDSSLKGVFDISGTERITFIDVVKTIRSSTKSRVVFVRVPIALFRSLLKTWAIFDRNPPFTAQQLDALVADEIFSESDWPNIFGVQPTSFRQAIDETFTHPVFSQIEL